jgi:peptidoglycan hydrolase-like protein with peptidoglycan-binding domain
VIPRWFTRELGPGDTGPDVAVVARKLAKTEPEYDDDLCARVRGLQGVTGLPVTGVVDAETAAVLGERAAAGKIPSWFGTPEQDSVLVELLHDADGLRRFQSAHRLPVTGVLDTECAILLADVYCL